MNGIHDYKLKCTSDLIAHRLETFWTGTRLIPSPFLISFRPLRNGSVLACSTACSSAAIGVKMSDYGIAPWLPRNGTAKQHYSVEKIQMMSPDW